MALKGGSVTYYKLQLVKRKNEKANLMPCIKWAIDILIIGRKLRIHVEMVRIAF